MARFLGLDGGGTGCRALLVDASGAELGRGMAGPANIVSDPEGARAAILDAIAQTGAGDMAGVTAVLGLAGANLAGAAGRLSLPFPARIVTDAEIAVAGALGPRDGIVALIGTGSAFLARKDGKLRQLGGWGLALGDEGSGGWIGRQLLARALHAHDELTADTALLADLRDRMGGPDGISGFAARATPADFARLAPEVLTSDDPAAQAVSAEAADWALRYIGCLPDDLPVCFAGGAGPSLGARLDDRLGARRIEPLGGPLDGALALAREAADG